MLIQIAIISIKDKTGFLKPKNKTLHNEFKTKLIPKTHATFFFSFFLALVHEKYKLKTIKKYNAVQTGPNNQLGGVKLGLFCKYQSLSTVPEVKMLPIKATK